jgi:ABC-type branched-subunit amino acid transport system ATPase component
MNYGSKIADGPPNSVMEDDAVKCAYLGSETDSGD